MIKRPLLPPPSPPFPPLPHCNPKQSGLLSKMGGNGPLFGPNILGESGDEGMTRKPIKKLSLELQSYVTIIWKVFPQCSKLFWPPLYIDCCKQEDAKGKYSSERLYCRCRLQLYENLMGSRFGTFRDTGAVSINECPKKNNWEISLGKLRHSQLFTVARQSAKDLGCNRIRNYFSSPVETVAFHVT